MKRLAVTLVLLLIIIPACAFAGNGKATTSFGLKAGYINSKLHIRHTSVALDNNILTPTSISGSEKGNGFNLGCAVRTELKHIYFQFELLYGRTEFNNIITPDNTRLKVATNNIGVPLLVGASVNPSQIFKLRFNLGPVLNIVSIPDIPNDAYNINSDMFKQQFITWTLGVGFDIVGIMFDFRYNGSFTDKKTTINSSTKTHTNISSVSLSLGYMF